ncbi:hypothetical protein XA68_12032 [Ophiocordyceps unilateralis]|uniref:Uncharacterized protein n=1 Tax=Ophiocordyceps unilateralis TaxID=268505 RepID=A0A2A9PFM1_OPHUN|nr:hypothetical protein XA68_12032 [Ophiocordyceps unilateralis]
MRPLITGQNGTWRIAGNQKGRPPTCCKELARRCFTGASLLVEMLEPERDQSLSGQWQQGRGGKGGHVAVTMQSCW